MNLNDILPIISKFFLEHQLLGILLSGIIAFIESLAIVGSIIPGSVVMTIVGFMLGAGIISIKYTLISVFVGAFIGDFISYALGIYFKTYITNHRWVQPYQHWLHHGEAFMRKHGALSIIIGRFVGPMRSMIPMIAGIANMNLFIFTLTIIPTIILWAIVYLTPGILLGSLSIDMGESLFSGMMYNALVIITLFALWHSLYSIIRIVYPYLQQKIHKNLLSPESLTHLLKFTIIFFLLGYLTKILLNSEASNNWYNLASYNFALSHTSYYEVKFAQITSLITSPNAYIIYNIAIIAVLYYHRHSKIALYWALSAASLFSFTALMKLGIQSPRPNAILGNDSFPSGHVLLNGTLMLCFSTITQRAAPSVGLTVRRFVFILIFAIIVSRILLQTHWLTDVIYSGLLSLAIWHLFSAFQHHLPILSRQHIKQIGASLTLVIIPLALLAQHLPMQPQPHIPEETTINKYQDIKNIPTLRYSRFGEIVAPINIIWSGTNKQFIDTFTNDGWENYPLDTNILQRLHTLVKFNDYHAVLPILPPLLDNKSPDAILGKVTNEHAYIVKLWKTAGKKPVYIGTISIETYPESFFTSKLFMCQQDRYNINNISLPKSYKIIQHSHKKIIKTINAFCWDGQTALLEA